MDKRPSSSEYKKIEADVFPLLVAHRGAQDEAAENTTTAFRAALSHRIDGIEIDVQFTRDSVPVLHHDRTLARSTGLRRRISDFTYSELADMVESGVFSDRLRGEPLLRLDEALQEFGGTTRLFIEIKFRDADRRKGHTWTLTETVVDLVRRIIPDAQRDSIVIVSFDSQVIETIQSIEPDWKTIMNHTRPGFGRSTEVVDTGGLWGYGLRIGLLNADDVRYAHDRNQKIMTWAVNGPRQFSKAFRLGADIILSDHPGWLVHQAARLKEGL